MNFQAIACINGSIFAMCQSDHLDKNWSLEKKYYTDQYCQIIKGKDLKFSDKCTCDHCNNLVHEFKYS